MPIVGTHSVPQHLKVLLALAITMLLLPVLKPVGLAEMKWSSDLIGYVLREVMIGLSLGYLTRLVFMAAEVSGQILGFVLGFNAAELVNPMHGTPTSLFEQFQSIFAMLLFLSFNGHHILFEAIYKSFQLAPVFGEAFHFKSLIGTLEFFKAVLEIGVKLAGPVIAVMVITNLALGVVGKAVPQINVFVTSFPVNILAGLAVLIASIPLMLVVMETDMVRMSERVIAFVRNF